LRILDVVEPTVFQTYIAHRKDVPLSSHGARFAAALRGQMESAARARPVRKNNIVLSFPHVLDIDLRRAD
jgi:hypothetical protein